MNCVIETIALCIWICTKTDARISAAIPHWLISAFAVYIVCVLTDRKTRSARRILSFEEQNHFQLTFPLIHMIMFNYFPFVLSKCKQSRTRHTSVCTQTRCRGGGARENCCSKPS